MDYPFQDFLRNVRSWSEGFRQLADVPTRPYDPNSKWVHVGDDSDEQATMLRIDYMLAQDGCSPSQLKYRATRFHHMMRFIALHEIEFGRAGFFIIDHGSTQMIASAVLRAVHELFRGEPVKLSRNEPVESAIARAVSYPPRWKYE